MKRGGIGKTKTETHITTKGDIATEAKHIATEAKVMATEAKHMATEAHVRRHRGEKQQGNQPPRQETNNNNKKRDGDYTGSITEYINYTEPYNYA